MHNLREQGEATLASWKAMMLNYKALWTRPFFLLFITAILTGILTSLVSSYLLMRKQSKALQVHESTLSSYKHLVLWYWEREREKNEKNKTRAASDKSAKILPKSNKKR